MVLRGRDTRSEMTRDVGTKVKEEPALVCHFSNVSGTRDFVKVIVYMVTLSS